ncbi:MAG: ribosome small subunit-dependent GTPase A [Labilithrix sp.]|nr:ribosome small subunit-dependent GTPase A [Labilithrix sp.]
MRRIERTLTLVRDAGVTPVVVLTKADVALEPTAAKRAAGVIAGASVFALGLQDPLGALSRECLAPARTAIMLGPSGAGKSTLANRLLGEDRLTVGDVRRRDAKGRHTTTHRELVVLENGALLIDGPGIRELGLWADEGAVADTFEEIHRLAQGCRFRDCEHHGEPGCAVREALARGELDAGRLGSFQKLARESEYEASRTDAALRLERQRSARALSRAARAAVRRKRGCPRAERRAEDPRPRLPRPPCRPPLRGLADAPRSCLGHVPIRRRELGPTPRSPGGAGTRRGPDRRAKWDAPHDGRPIEVRRRGASSPSLPLDPMGEAASARATWGQRVQRYCWPKPSLPVVWKFDVQVAPFAESACGFGQ